ncbi:myb-binding protein 1A [Achroia grisella]|uniref:myb-binding protein 1A n=1 Tax=Achroia grisella TaxID=688607 RepID=UPI0027D1F8FC|nr:myb-binding protein 1A [Achroia grisella]
MVEETEPLKPQKNLRVTASVLDAFALLVATKDEEKLSGGAKIISHLQGSENDKDIQYVMKRLVRSLGANVAELRTGHFATLVTILNQFNKITVSDLLELVKKELHANSSSKSEVGNVALGQILLCGAVFRSGLMFRSSDDEQKEILQLLLGASKKKSYLSTVAYFILLDFVNGINKEQFSSIIWQNIKQEFKKTVKEHTIDSLYFLMMVNNKFPDKVKMKKLLGVPDLLCEENIHIICEKLMTGLDFNSVRHPIYEVIGCHIAKSPHLQVFWSSGIDSQLVKHNRNRELAALNILRTIVVNIDDNVEAIPELISKNFFKLFMDWFKGLQTASKIRSKRDDEDDHKIMIKKQKEFLNCLAKALKSSKVTNNIRLETLKKLLFSPGEINFTEITGTNIVKSIIADLDKESVKIIAKMFKGVLLNKSKRFVKEGFERNWYNYERVKAAELLSYLVTQEAVKDDTEFKLTYMKIMMCFGFFKIGGDENVAVGSEISGSIKTCFYRCFTSRFSNVDSLVSVLSALSNFISNILQKEEIRTKLEKQFPAESVECWEMLTHVCQSIEQNGSNLKVDKVFLILLYQLGLFLFSEPTHVKVARSSIKELKSCYEHYRKDRKKKPNNSKEHLSEEPEWIEVLVEVLLSILSVDSSVLRAVVQCVFRLLWEFLTPSAIGQIVSVLDPDSETDLLTQDSGSEGEESDNTSDEDETENNDDNPKENGKDSEDSDVEEEEDEEMKTPDQLRLAVQKALGTIAAESDAESLDADMIDEEDGRKLDEALAEAFSQFQQGKGRKSKKDRKDKKALSDFRIRVLDLLDIYLEKDPSMDICLGMIAPLIRCLEFCIQDNQFSELENRVRKTIRTLTKIRKFVSTDDVTLDVLCDYLKSTIEKGERSHFLYQAVGDIITYFSTFIIHCSQKINNENSKLMNKSKIYTSPLTEILIEALQNYFLNRNCLLPIIFFHNILQSEWDGNYELAIVIVDNIFNSNVRQFRRNEGIELIAGFYRTLKRNKPTTDNTLNMLTKLEMKFENKLKVTLQTETDFQVKPNFFVLLKKLINTMKMFHESCKIKLSIDIKTLLDIVSSSKGSVKSQGKTQMQESQVKQNNNIHQTKKNKKKRKAAQINGCSEPQPKKVRKPNTVS